MLINPQLLQKLGLEESQVFVNGQRLNMIESINTDTQTAYLYEIDEEGKVMTNGRGNPMMSSEQFVYAEVVGRNVTIGIGDKQQFDQLMQEQMKEQAKLEGTDAVPLGEPDGEEGTDGADYEQEVPEGE